LKEDHSCIGRVAAQRETRLKRFGSAQKPAGRFSNNIPQQALAAPGFNSSLYPEKSIDKQTQEELDHQLAMQLQQSYSSTSNVRTQNTNSRTRNTSTGNNCVIS